mmetsp:Transcript_54008/g.142930  ORF Transcript_54008/g.142930 Transcript_54008/m.142930 type:complete len:96 (-) Transcript_54008:430-717(-)
MILELLSEACVFSQSLILNKDEVNISTKLVEDEEVDCADGNCSQNIAHVVLPAPIMFHDVKSRDERDHHTSFPSTVLAKLYRAHYNRMVGHEAHL